MVWKDQNTDQKSRNINRNTHSQPLLLSHHSTSAMQLSYSALCLLVAGSLAHANTNVQKTTVVGNNNNVNPTSVTKQSQSTDLKIPVPGKRSLYARSLMSLVQRDPEFEYAMQILGERPPDR